MSSSTLLSPRSPPELLALNFLRGERERRREAQRHLDEARRDADAVRARCKTMLGFMRESWHVLEPGPYVEGWHQDAACDHLEAATRGEITRLQINQPPGTMKSTTTAVIWNAWEWTNPQLAGMRYFTTSWHNDYSTRDSRRTRDLIQSEWYQTLWPHVRLVRTEETDFANSMLGARKARPFSGLTSGRGNRLVIDDPQSTEEVESDVDREKKRRIFRESATSRLNDPKRDVIVVMQHRLHPEDICGLIEELGLPYVKLILPMEYVRSTTVSTKWFTDPRKVDGELLCPARIPRETIELNKIELGQHAYDTQYQQQARGRDGTYFFLEESLLVQGQPIEMPTKCDAVFAIVDTAVKPGKKRDGTGVAYYAVINHPRPLPGAPPLPAGTTPDRLVIALDWDIQQIKAAMLEHWLPDVFTRLEELAKICGARQGSLGAWIEDKASGTVLLQQAENKPTWVTHPLDGVLVAAGKEGRAISVGGYVNKGRVKISRPAYEKTMIYKGRSRNHFLWQITNYQMGKGTPNDEDDCFDTFCYGVAVACGNADGV